MKFAELSDSAKDFVRYNVLAPDSWWADDLKEMHREDAQAKGFTIYRVYHDEYSAAWEGSVDMDVWIEREDTFNSFPYKPIIQELIRNEAICSATNIRVAYSGRSIGRMVCDGFEIDLSGELREGMMAGANVQVLFDAIGGYEAATNALSDAVLADAIEDADVLFKKMQEEWEYMHTDEYLLALCEANDYEFDEDGHLVVQEATEATTN